MYMYVKSKKKNMKNKTIQSCFLILLLTWNYLKISDINVNKSNRMILQSQPFPNRQESHEETKKDNDGYSNHPQQFLFPFISSIFSTFVETRNIFGEILFFVIRFRIFCGWKSFWRFTKKKSFGNTKFFPFQFRAMRFL